MVEKGWAGFSGEFGTVEFVDGFTAYPVPPMIADRLSACMQMEEYDSIPDKNDENSEVGKPAGIANRLIGGATLAPPKEDKTLKVSEEELKEEKNRKRLDAGNPNVKRFYSQDELLHIADKAGVKGLRVVAEPWNIKGKAMEALINDIVAAQDEFQKVNATGEEKLADPKIEEMEKFVQENIKNHGARRVFTPEDSMDEVNVAEKLAKENMAILRDIAASLRHNPAALKHEGLESVSEEPLDTDDDSDENDISQTVFDIDPPVNPVNPVIVDPADKEVVDKEPVDPIVTNNENKKD